MANAVLFLTLKVFSATGGIEKVCRVAGKALNEIQVAEGGKFRVMSMYESSQDAAGNKYFPAEKFKGFNKRKSRFIFAAIKAGMYSDVIILSHINLLLAGWLIKKIRPSKKLILLAHGIEVWEPFSAWKKIMLNTCNEIISVSNFTSASVQEQLKNTQIKFSVVNNCLDPFLPPPTAAKKNPALLKKYSIGANDPVLLTLTRLSATERVKGYHTVMGIVAQLKKKYPSIRYLLAGKADAAERKFLEQLICTLHLEENVILTGYVADDELAEYFQLADLYVMPSKKEGFGIIFIEAMFYGLPVIAGNKDGSADALLNGELGLLVNPDDVDEIKNAIEKMLGNSAHHKPDPQKLMQHFSFETYKENFKKALNSIKN